MPLKRARDECVSGIDGIRFLMRDGVIEVPCRISFQALVDVGRTLDLTEPEEVFIAYREAIELAASIKYDRTPRRHYEIVTLTAADVISRTALGFVLNFR